MAVMDQTIALIGFGEAGSTFAASAGWGKRARAFDIRADRAAIAAEHGVPFCVDPASALHGAQIVLSLVSADAALHVARDYAAFLAPGTLWCDMNSVAPETKRAAAAHVEAAGARYIDVAVLAPVYPARMDVPLLIAGDAADDAAHALGAAGFANTRTVGAEIGRASAIKMIRSVMVKGIEALTAEMMLAATSAGVAQDVLASLDASERGESWFKRAPYNIERMTTHGARRAAEMEESVKTLTSLGVEPVMTAGTVRRQREQAGRTIPMPTGQTA
jgi:3-hydroxyisobutyrate dehydrogenase-like beta-hydroxyacid dehydrogenase